MCRFKEFPISADDVQTLVGTQCLQSCSSTPDYLILKRYISSPNSDIHIEFALLYTTV